jgi:hypothetical protein
MLAPNYLPKLGNRGVEERSVFRGERRADRLALKVKEKPTDNPDERILEIAKQQVVQISPEQPSTIGKSLTRNVHQLILIYGPVFGVTHRSVFRGLFVDESAH